MNVDRLILQKSNEIAFLYRELETEILVSLAKMIKVHGLTATGEYQLRRLVELGMLTPEVLIQISKITGTPLEKIYEAINQIGYSSIDFPMFREAHKKGILKDIDSISIDPFIEAMQLTSKEYITGVQLHAQEAVYKEFSNSITKAVISVNTGLKTPNQAMVDSVRDMARKGITGATYLREGEPYQMGIESVVYRAIRTEFVKASNEVSHNVGLELGVEEWYVTEHVGARYKVRKDAWENHMAWQGRVLTTQELYDIAGYGQMLGLGGINCRHRHYAYVKGVSKLPEQRVEDEVNKEVYDLEQKRNRLQTEIRKIKRTIISLEELGDIEEVNNAIIVEKIRLKKYQAKVRNLVKESKGLIARVPRNEQIVS